MTAEEGAADGKQEEGKEDGRPASVHSGVDGANSSRKENLNKVLSHKAIQIGSESGVTAEFIVK